METVDQAVIHSIGEILTPFLADEVIAEVRELLKARQADPRAGIDAEIAAVAAQIGNLDGGRGHGRESAGALARLQQAEGQHRRLVQQRVEIPAGLSLAAVDWRSLEFEARQTLASWRTLATRHVTEARELLTPPLPGPIVSRRFMKARRSGTDSVAGWRSVG